MPDVDVAVIGAGISGLTFAHYLKKRGISTILIESSTEAGGYIRTINAGPYVAEGGPQSFTANANFVDLVNELGIAQRVRYAQAAATTRYIYLNGRLVAVPTSPKLLLKSPIMSFTGKVRLLKELFTPPSDEGNETVAAFVTRRAGREALENIAAPVVSGIFAGDPAKLELKSAFPILAALERDHGSVLRGAMKKFQEAKTSDARASAATFDTGNRVLTDTLALNLGECMQLGSAVSKLSIFHGGIEVRCAWPGLAVTASRAVIATSAHAASDLLADADPSLAADLRAIDYVPIAQIVLAYPREAIRVPLDGFGMLVSPRAGLRILGAVWNSSVFAERAPANEALATAFVGGALHRDALDRSDAELAALAQEDLAAAMRITEKPRIVAGFRWEKAIPQYAVGHAERLRRIDAALSKMPRIALAGSYLRGISVGDCMRQARSAAEKFAV